MTPQSIIDAVNQLEESGAINKKAVQSLLAKLGNAQKKWDQNQCGPAGNIYGAFINAVQAQSGKSITPEAAEILVADAQYLITHCDDGELISESIEDSDSDGMPDAYERFYGLNPLSALDAAEDQDLDGSTNLEEFLSQSDPIDRDSIPINPRKVAAAVAQPASGGGGGSMGRSTPGV